MYCSNCGTQSSGNFCPECGEVMAGANRSAATQPTTMPNVPAGTPIIQTLQTNTPNVVYIPVQTQKRGFNGFGVAAFVIAIISYFYSALSMIGGNRWVCAALLAVQITLVVLGFVFAKKKYLGRGLTIAALVIACLNAYLLFFIFVMKDTMLDFLEDYSSLFGDSISHIFNKLI